MILGVSLILEKLKELFLSDSSKKVLGCFVGSFSYILVVGLTYVFSQLAQDLNYHYWNSQFKNETIETLATFSTIETERFFPSTEEFIIVTTEIKGEKIEMGILSDYAKEDNRDLYLQLLYEEESPCKVLKIRYSKQDMSIFKIVGCK